MTLYVGPIDEPDKYELVEVRSRGGEGEVWKALLSVDSVRVPVAVKLILSSNETEIDTWRERWGRQAELLRSLQHPGLVTVREVFIGPGPHNIGAANATSSTLCLVMNWVDGPTLAEWTAIHPNRHALESMQVIGGLAPAVDYLHSGTATGQPVLHRDIKPANVIIADDGPQLVDFGFVRTQQHGKSMTMVGTPAYISPEAAAGLEYTPASDRYGLGATAYFALTGEAPIPHDAARMRQRLSEVRGLEDREDLHDHILSMLNMDPKMRPTSAVNWAQNLAAMSVVGGSTTVARQIAIPQPPSEAPTETPAPPAGGRKGKLALFGTIAAVLVAAVIGVGILSSGDEGDSDSAAESQTTVATEAPGASQTTTADDSAAVTTEPASTPEDTAPMVPTVIGMSESEARSALAGVGLTVVEVVTAGSEAPEGTVLEVSPAEGSSVSDGGVVTLTVAVAQTVAVPDLIGDLDDTALSQLTSLGLTDITVERSPSVMPTDSVVGISPGPGTEVLLGTSVILTVADPLEAPSFLGQSLEDATAQAEALGAAVIVEEVYSPGVEAGELFEQNPPAGDQMTETLRLTVGQAPGVLLLEDLGVLNSSRASFGQGEIDGETYIHALNIGRSLSWTTGYAEFNLSKDFDILQFTAGYNDNSGSEGVIRLEVFVDGTAEYVRDYRLGDGKDEVSVDVADGLRLRIEATVIQNSSTSEYVILGQVELLGDPDVVSQYYE